MLSFAEEVPTAPEVPLDDLITYYTLRHKFYRRSSDEATLKLLCRTRLIQKALKDLDATNADSFSSQVPQGVCYEAQVH